MNKNVFFVQHNLWSYLLNKTIFEYENCLVYGFRAAIYKFICVLY